MGCPQIIEWRVYPPWCRPWPISTSASRSLWMISSVVYLCFAIVHGPCPFYEHLTWAKSTGSDHSPPFVNDDTRFQNKRPGVTPGPLASPQRPRPRTCSWLRYRPAAHDAGRRKILVEDCNLPQRSGAAPDRASPPGLQQCQSSIHAASVSRPARNPRW